MHPIKNEFLETSDTLTQILERNLDKTSLLEVTFLKILKAKINGFDPDLFVELDQAIIKGHADPHVYLLFISSAIRFTSIRKQLERARVIESIGASLSKQKIHPLVMSYYIQSVAMLRFFEFNMAECNRLAKEALANIDKTSIRYNLFLILLASMVSLQGRLYELDKKDLALFESFKDGKLANNRANILLTNCMWTGNYKDGLLLQEEYKKNWIDDGTKVIQTNDNILKIISGDFDENSYQDELPKIYVNALRFLKMSDFENARLYSQRLQKISRISLMDFPFEEFLLIHIELGQKNKGQARLLLQEIEQKRGSHYLDDFFLARIQILELNFNGAKETFARLIESVKKYGAMNRLLFELQFAKELDASIVLQLMSGVLIENANNSYKKDASFTPKILGKGIQLLVGNSSAISIVKELVKKFAKLKDPVLITGETGTGKELVARAIHEEGPHPKEPFLAINCGALTESLLQSELFGYVAGAFTGAQKERKGIFESAGKGTVFLDEFGDISPQMQVSLLRVLESNEIRLIGGSKTRQIECKLVIATNIDLQNAVENKKFREDLYFRLTRFDIKLPPLRERKEDVPQLINYFLDNNKGPHEKAQRLSRDLLEALSNYRWTGNIRELKNEMERLKILHAEKEIINKEDFDFARLQGIAPTTPKIEEVKLEKKLAITKGKSQEIVLDHEQILKIVQRSTKAEIRHKVIKELFQTYKKLTRSQIVEITGMNPGSASKELQAFCNSGLIKKVTPTKSVKSHFFVLVEQR